MWVWKELEKGSCSGRFLRVGDLVDRVVGVMGYGFRWGSGGVLGRCGVRF